MNNEMNDFSIPGTPNEFSLPPSPTNYIAAFKRPLSSITPIIVTHTSNSSLYLIIGAAGGSRIITATAQATFHVIEHGMSVVEALEQRRMHDQLVPARTTFERGYDREIVEKMKEKGHNVTWIEGYESAVQGIRVLWNGTFEAGAEPRQKNSGGYAV
jgi:gamma-glutamyltranspeptidase/glutathione hydrolase